MVKADRELYTIMANEINGSLRPSALGVLPMDEAMKQLRVDPRVTMHLLLLPRARPSGIEKRGSDEAKARPKDQGAQTKEASYQEGCIVVSGGAQEAPPKGREQREHLLGIQFE